MDRRGSITTYVVIAVVLIFMIASCCILKQTNILRYGPRWWNRQNRKDDNNRPAKFESFEVVSVPTGNSIIVEGRGKRTKTITLGGIGIPSLPGAEEAARANLERLAGGTFQAEIPGRRLRTYTGRSGAEVQEGELWLAGNRRSDTLAQPEDDVGTADPAVACGESSLGYTPGPVEARSDFTSPFVKGENGVCLQLEQIRGGFAMIVAGPNDTIPAEWTAAEKAAKKSAIGIWSKP